jgi:Ca-activated chloride channel family protein
MNGNGNFKLMKKMKTRDIKSYFKRCCFLLVSALSLTIIDPLYGESLYSTIEKGSTLYQSEQYDEALKSFVDAQIESPENPQLKYNVANAHFNMKNYEEAIKNYQDVAATAQDIQLEEKSLYNIGNCIYRQGKLEEAVEYYKKALDLDPNDQDAKYNLEFVREEIKKRINEAKKREQQQQQQKESEKQEGEKEQKEQGQQPQPEEQKQKQQQEQQGKQQEKQEQPQPSKGEQEKKAGKDQIKKTKPMTPEEAERWLRSLKEDRKAHKKREKRKVTGSSRRPEKDW